MPTAAATPWAPSSPVASLECAASAPARSNADRACSLWPRSRRIQASCSAHAAASRCSPRASRTRDARVSNRIADACRPRAASRAPRSGESRSTRLTPTEGLAAAGGPKAYAGDDSWTTTRRVPGSPHAGARRRSRKSPGRPAAPRAASNSSSYDGPWSPSMNTIDVIAAIPIESMRRAPQRADSVRVKRRSTWRRALAVPI